ncbi:MAG: hypothetical protein Q8P02_05195 [Candidatus Micrarchaeota archaeon]|nr:hypothetical protein [Candidatus Micrarchaeota archaeon]
MRFLFALVLAALLAGCVAMQAPTATPIATATPSTATPTPGPAPAKTDAQFGQTVTLAAGQTARFSDGAELWFTDVSDSRCPSDVVCVWAGIVSVKAVVRQGAATAAFTPTAGRNATNVTLNTQSYAVQLKNVAPYPEQFGDTPLWKYRATFVLTTG